MAHQHHPGDPAPPPPAVSVELEHAIGFNGLLPGSLHALPGGGGPSGGRVLYASGACLVVASLDDPHDQTFLRGHSEPISCVDVSPDGRLAASGQRGRVADVIVWDLAAMQRLYVLQEHNAIHSGGIACVAFTEDARFLLTVGIVPEDRKMMVWDMNSGYIVASTDRPAQVTVAKWGGRVKDVKRRPTTHPQLVTGGEEGLRYWDLDPLRGLASEPVFTSTQKRVVTCLSWSAAEDLIFAGTLTGDFLVLNAPRRLSSGELEKVQLRLSVMVCSGGVHSLAVSGRYLYVGGGDGTVTFFDTDPEDGFKPRRAADGLRGRVTSLAIRGPAAEGEGGGNGGGGGARLVYGTSDCVIYDHTSGGGRGAPPRLVSEAHAGRVVAVAYAPGDSVRFATAGEDLTVRVWNASDYSVETRCLTRDAGSPLCLAFSGPALFVGWADGKVRAYDADESEELWALDDAHRGGVTALALSHNQRFLCTGGARGDVRVWELRSRQLVSHLAQHDDAVSSLALSDDDLLLYSSSRDKSFICWDLRIEKRLSSRSQHSGAMNGLVLLPAPTPEKQVYVMTVGQERKLTYWDMRIPEPLNLVPVGQEQLCVAASSNGNVVAIAGVDRVVRVLDTVEYAVVAACEGHSDAVVGLRFSPDDRQLVSVGADGCVMVWNVYMP